MSTNRTWHHGSLANVKGLSFDDQLVKAGLNWRVETSPIKYGNEFQYISGVSNDGSKLEGKAVAAYRSDTGELIDVYYNRQPWQNDQILGHFHEFCVNAQLEIDHLGYVANSIMASAKLPYVFDCKQVGDVSEYYILLTDSHKNGRGLSIALFENRLVCTNGMKRKVQVGNHVIRHVGGMNKDRIEKVFAATLVNAKQRAGVLESLAEVSLSESEATLHIIKAFGDPTLPIHSQPKEVQTILRLYKGNGKASELPTAFNTAYGLLQSVTEYFNWQQKGSFGSRAFASVLDGTHNSKMSRFENQIVGVCLN